LPRLLFDESDGFGINVALTCAYRDLPTHGVDGGMSARPSRSRLTLPDVNVPVGVSIPPIDFARELFARYGPYWADMHPVYPFGET